MKFLIAKKTEAIQFQMRKSELKSQLSYKIFISNFQWFSNKINVYVYTHKFIKLCKIQINENTLKQAHTNYSLTSTCLIDTVLATILHPEFELNIAICITVSFTLNIQHRYILLLRFFYYIKLNIFSMIKSLQYIIFLVLSPIFSTT